MLDTIIHMMPIDEVQSLSVMELANEYPLLVDDQEVDLIASIEANGIREPLILFKDPMADDALLDGRNRLASAIKVGLDEVPVRYFVGTIEEAEDLIIDLNEKRRHLLPVQRAYIADKHRAIVAKRAEERMKAGKKIVEVNPSTGEVLGSEPTETGRTSEILAKKHNAGRNSIDVVQKIRRVAQETMQDPDNDGDVMTPRAIKANAVLNKMQKGTITISDAVKNVFGEPGQEINPDDQSKISTAKQRMGKIVTDLLSNFGEAAQTLMETGNDVDQEYVRQKLIRLTGFINTMNAKYGADEFDNLIDPDENRDRWSDVESRNQD